MILYDACTRKRLYILLVTVLPSASGQLFVTFFSSILFLVFGLLVQARKSMLLLLSLVVSLLTTLLSVKEYINLAIGYLIDIGLPSRGLLIVSRLLQDPQMAASVLGTDSIIVKVSGLTGAIAVLVAKPFNLEPGSYTSPAFVNSISDVHHQIEHFVFSNPNYVGFDRPYGPIGSIVIDFGIVGLLCVIPCMAQLIRLGLLNRGNIYYLVSVFFILQLLILRMPLAHPAPWFLYASAISLSSPRIEKL